MLRMIRTALLALIPLLASGALLSACSDDTTGTTTQDMTAVAHDLAMPTHDLAKSHD